MQKRKKIMVNEVVKKAVANFLVDNPDPTARELKKAVEKSLNDKGYNYKFTERTYLNLKKELGPNASPTAIDAPWTIGVSVKADIPADIIPKLIEWQAINHKVDSKGLFNKASDVEIKKIVDAIKTAKPNTDIDEATKITKEIMNKHLEKSKFLTIREARWFAKLYPTIISLAKKKYPRAHPIKQEIWVYNLSHLFANRERIAEVLGSEYPDTTDIDAYIAKGDLSEELNSLFVWDVALEQMNEFVKRLGIQNGGEK